MRLFVLIIIIAGGSYTFDYNLKTESENQKNCVILPVLNIHVDHKRAYQIQL